MLLGHSSRFEEFEELITAGKLSHGYIFFGASRIGKKEFGRALARRLEFGSFAKVSTPPTDYLEISPEGSSIGIESVRKARTYLYQRPGKSERRVLLVDDSELLTDEAQNALLKLAEEPPTSSLVILVSSDPARLRETVVSRFQKIGFGMAPHKEISAWLIREHAVKEKEAAELAMRSGGRTGLAHAMATSPDFRRKLEEAGRYLSVEPAARKELIKSLTDDEEFRLYDFLELVIIAGKDIFTHKPAFWHQLLELRMQADASPLNSRLQLSALAEYLL